EAVPGLTLRVHVEAGAVLLVERAQAPEVLVPLREAHIFLDDLDQVDLGLDLREGVVGRQGGHVPIVMRLGLYRRRLSCGALETPPPKPFRPRGTRRPARAPSTPTTPPRLHPPRLEHPGPRLR